MKFAKQIIKQVILEHGNPLARLHHHIQSGRHFSVISAQRSHLTLPENRLRYESLKKDLGNLGYGFKESEGRYVGETEPSFLVYAKDVGPEHGERLRHDMNTLGEKYDQDSVFHWNGDIAYVEGTNKTSDWPGYGQKAMLGKIKMNLPHTDYETELRPSREKSSARFRTVEDDDGS